MRLIDASFYIRLTNAIIAHCGMQQFKIFRYDHIPKKLDHSQTKVSCIISRKKNLAMSSDWIISTVWMLYQMPICIMRSMLVNVAIFFFLLIEVPTIMHTLNVAMVIQTLINSAKQVKIPPYISLDKLSQSKRF